LWGHGGNSRFTWDDTKGCIMSKDTTHQDIGLINVSNLPLRQLADELDESSLAATLRRLLDPREGYGEEIASFNSALPLV
jgi:FXSXX-COOH protein